VGSFTEELVKSGRARVVAEGVAEVAIDDLGPFDFGQTTLTKEEQEAFDCQELWVSGRYTVYVRYGHPTGWSMTGENGEERQVALCHLSIKRHDREPIHDWRDLQMIKTILCGEESEAMELYPAESRVVDTSNQYHLWVLPKGLTLPFGFNDGRLVTEHAAGKAKQRPFEYVPPGTISREEVHERARRYVENAGLDPKEVLGDEAGTTQERDSQDA
jgi:hypothetical protein